MPIIAATALVVIAKGSCHGLSGGRKHHVLAEVQVGRIEKGQLDQP